MIQHIEIGKNALVKHGCTLVKMSRLTKPGPAPTGYAYSHLPSAAGKSLDIMQHLHKPYKGAASKHPAIQEMRKLALEAAAVESRKNATTCRSQGATCQRLRKTSKFKPRWV